MHRSTDRILTTHAGSLPRPAALTHLYAERARGAVVDPAKIEEAGRTALRWVVPKQRDAGIDIGNNGEQQREAFFLYVQRRMSGFGGSWERHAFADMIRYPAYAAQTIAQAGAAEHVSLRNRLPKAIGEVRYLDRAAIESECADFGNVLKETGAGFAEPFLTAPSPGIIATAMLNEYYDSMQNYLAALGEALRVEYETIVRHGFLLQVDAPDLAMERHITFQDRPLADFVKFIEQVIATINTALANVPREKVRLHVCWGNYEGPHDYDIPLEKIIGIILRAKPAAIQFEASNPRHVHEWAVWKSVRIPEDKILIPGLLTSTSNYVEHPELVAQRICQFADIVGRERVIAGTDCGFGTFAGIGKMDAAISFKKLRALVEGAELASKRLWSR